MQVRNPTIEKLKNIKNSELITRQTTDPSQH